MDRVNLIIATWSGARREVKPRRASEYLHAQFKHLETTPHTIDQITVVAPITQDPPDFSDALTQFSDVVRRPTNGAYSYGSFAFVAKRRLKEFTHFILVEDDTVLVQPYFDQTLRRLLAADMGMICGIVYPMCGDLHPASCVGMCRAEALADWWSRESSPDEESQETYAVAEHWQVQWGHGLQRAGWKIGDWLHEFSTEFWYWHGGARLFGDATRPVMQRPLQTVIP